MFSLVGENVNIFKIMLTTTDKVKSYLGITSTDYDTVLGELVDNVDSFIKHFIERDFSNAEYTEYHDGGVKEIFIKEYPIDDTATITVYYNGNVQSDPNWNEIDASNYTVYYDEGVVRHAGKFPAGKRNIKIVYTGGYSTIPDDIELLAKQLVAKAFEQRKAQGKATETIESTTIDWKATITPEQKMIIDKYRRVLL